MFNSDITRIRKLLPAKIGWNITFTLLCAVIALLTFTEPTLLGAVIDSAIDQRLYNELYLIFAVIIVFLLRMALTYQKNGYAVKYRCRAIKALSAAMLNYIMRAKIEYYSKNNAAYLVSRIIDEPALIDGALDYFYIDGCFSILICIGIITIIFLQSWVIGILSVLFIAADYFIAMKLPLKKVYKEYNESLAVCKGKASNIIQGVKVIKLGNRYDEEESNFNDYAEAA